MRLSEYIRHWDRTDTLLTVADGVPDAAVMSLYLGYLIACVSPGSYEERKVMVMNIVQFIESKVDEEVKHGNTHSQGS